MRSVNYKTILDSIKFLIKLSRKSEQPRSYIPLEFENCSARFYEHTGRNKKGLMVIFHGGNRLGNADPRYLNLIQALDSLGYDCLAPQIEAFVLPRISVPEDFDQISKFLSYLLANKIDALDNISFIGASTACLYMIKVATNIHMSKQIKSICLISPYYNPQVSLRAIMETPKDAYAQLIILRLVLYSKNEFAPDAHSKRELMLLDRVINYYFEQKKTKITEDIYHFISKESSQDKRLLELIKKMGTPDFITDESYPFLNEVINQSEYSECLPHLKSKITLVHSYSDAIFLPENSSQLSNALSQYNINNHLVITKMLDHANLVNKHVIRESILLIKAFAHFFSK